MNEHLEKARHLARRIAIRSGLARLRRDEGGATAVEFAIVALPFIALLVAILETALMFFAGQAMDTAVDQAARMVRTGQAQQQGLDINKFKEQICGQISLLFDCPAGLKIDVEKYATFDSINLGVPRTRAATSTSPRTSSPATAATSWWCVRTTSGRCS